MIPELSDISRTNQIQLLLSPEQIAEKIYQYLWDIDKEIECFTLDYKSPDRDDFYKKRHQYIKKQIQKRLLHKGIQQEISDIQYFLAYGKPIVFFLSPKSATRNHSGWKDLFKDNRERILNLVFKFYLLSLNLSADSLKGFEELLLVHSKNLTKDKKALIVWGQNLLIKYNYHNVLTLTLSRKRRRFLPLPNRYRTVDGDDLGELVVFKKKNYYFERDLDARHKNDINFMRFDKDDQNFEKFQKTQLYHYHNLMDKLESFLRDCKIEYRTLDFQADHYLLKPFVTKIETGVNWQAFKKVEIINNTGVDINETEQRVLRKILKHRKEIDLTFYNSGKTITLYEQVAENENNDDVSWKIMEAVSWDSIKLNQETNYLVFNKILEEESGSVAYQAEDEIWYSFDQIDNKEKVDFYSYLKRKYNYLNTGNFLSMQGRNVEIFQVLGEEKEADSLLKYTEGKLDENDLLSDTRDFEDGQFLDIKESIYRYLSQQNDGQEIEKFLQKFKIDFSPEFKKIFMEIEIKDWIAKSLTNPNIGLQIVPPSFSEKRFFALYVRNPKDGEVRAVAVEFLYKDSFIYIENVIRDIKRIEEEFKFLRRRKNNPEQLINDQEYLVDESKSFYIRWYTDNLYTPTLIGREGILEEMNNGTLEINRSAKDENSSRILSLVSRYNGKLKPMNIIHDLICLDQHNESFIQYFIPPAQAIDKKIKRGFRVYHLIGKRYDKGGGEAVPTSELIKHPLTELHFSTLTQDILKLGENSTSSLLQKITRVFVEN
ncbi:hypothetical protein V0288_07605 [Pannus brasiliensis CCIBt3594]|uniref:Uncharacterized protein n=1 Tax=Pannus brasiliensis CCIBt3594 TaxID=1427578 RepID=A0AAW9QTX9_9CHRO